MRSVLSRLTCVMFLTGLSACAVADTGVSAASGWHLDSEASGMTFVSTTQEGVGEIHTFRGIAGYVSDVGEARITLRVDSIDTNDTTRDAIVRDEVLKTRDHPIASVTSQIDMAQFSDLETGQATTVLADLDITITGVTVSRPFFLLVTRLGEDKVLVSNKAPLLLDASAFGLTDTLSEFVQDGRAPVVLPTVPVTMNFVFEHSGEL